MCLSWTRSRESEMEEGILYSAKYNGPPPRFNAAELNDVANFMNIDSDLWVFRRFEKLHLLNILGIQHRLMTLEHQFETQISKPKVGGFVTLMPEIQIALKEYDAALLSQANYKSYKAPEDHVLKLMTRWASDTSTSNGQPLLSALDAKFGKDFASIGGAQKTWTHEFIDKHNCLRRLFVKKGPLHSDEHWTTLIYSEESVRKAEAVVLHASFCFLLLCPVIAMLYLRSRIWKLVLLGVFLFAASILSVGFLNTPNKSGLALVAGYAAILVVFLSGNIGS